MNKNIIGGKLISGEDQGYRAGLRAIKIIKGTPADSLPINTNSLSQFTFSHPMLEKHNIDEEKLPEESLIINSPQSLYSIHRNLIIGVLSALLIAVIIILMLTNAIIRRRRAEKELLIKQRHLKESLMFRELMADIVALLNSTNDFTSVTSTILKHITSHYNIDKVALYNFDDNESVANIISSNVSDTSSGITELHPVDYHKLKRIINELRTGNRFISANLSNITEMEKSFYEDRKIRAIAAFPIRIGKHMFGMAGFAQSTPYHWPDKIIHELETIVQMIANAWERNAQMNKHLEAKEQNLKATRLIEKSARMASVGVIASGITHEINQPLNAMKITVDGMRYMNGKGDIDIPDVVMSKLDTISKGILRIDKIIKQMRNYWITPSSNTFTEKVDLNKAVSNAFSLLEHQFKDNQIKGILTLSETTLWIHGNFIQIEQIIINLAVNAIQAICKKNKGSKKVSICVSEQNMQAVITIADTGTGIPDEIGEKLYDPFYSTKQEDQGTGLGLAIVKTFIDRIDGTIQYENNKEAGVTFTVKFQKIQP